MQFTTKISPYIFSTGKQFKMLWADKFKMAAMFLLLALVCVSSIAEAGGKGKGGEEDIIMYNGNIVLRGDKKGGSIVMANNHHSHNEEVEFSPSFFTGFGGDMGGFRRRRR